MTLNEGSDIKVDRDLKEQEYGSLALDGLDVSIDGVDTDIYKLY